MAISLGVILEPTVLDPVCGMRLEPSHAAGTHTHHGTTYYFCAEICRRKFRKHPQAYLDSSTPKSMSAMLASPAGVYICPMCPEVKSDGPATCPSCGMALEPAMPTARGDEPDPETIDFTHRLRIGLIFGVPLVIFAMADMLSGMAISHAVGGHRMTLMIQSLLAIPVLAWVAIPLHQRFLASLRNRSPNMFTLIGLGVTAAVVYSSAATLDGFGVRLFPPAFRGSMGMVEPFWESAVVIVLLVLLGQLLELRARHRTGDALRQLLTLAPPTATVLLANQREAELPLDLVELGDRLRVKPGSRIPLDGRVIEGRSFVNESMLTGEAMPTAKSVGEWVSAGTLNGEGALQVEVTRAVGDTVLAHMIALVSQAQRSRLPIQSRVDRVAAWFVPIVVVIAVLAWLGWSVAGQPAMGVVCGMAVLVVACPCALGLATPMAVVVGVGQAARRGVLVRDGEAIERLARVRTLVFDKTGTLTVGQPSVVYADVSDEALRFAAAVEVGSEHPFANAVVEYARTRGLTWPNALEIQAERGWGVRGVVEGRTVAVGRESPGHHPRGSESTNSRAVVIIDGVVAGSFEFADAIRPNAAETIAELLRQHFAIVMLSGDRRIVAERVARELGIPTVFAETLPTEKHAVIERFRPDVAMIGDGINDSAALAVADVGIAMGTGSDLAKSAASMTLLRSDLALIPVAIQLSRAIVRTIRQNVWLAFGYNAIMVPLAAFGVLSPIAAAAAMSLSSISVIANSLRLRKDRL